MKKLLLCCNALLLCISLLLGFLLLNANDRLRQVQAQSISTPTPTPVVTPSTVLTPVPQIPETTEGSEVYFSEYIVPFGSLPAQCVSQFCDRSLGAPIPDLEEQNPIDDFFESYWHLLYSTMEENHMSGDYRDAWKEEMLHAYELLAQKANPEAEYLFEELEQTKQAMLDFTKKDGDLFATVFYSDGYDEIFHFDEKVREGTGWPGASLLAQAAHYRGYTIYLYRVLNYMDVEPDFVFDPEPLRETWSYLLD